MNLFNAMATWGPRGVSLFAGAAMLAGVVVGDRTSPSEIIPESPAAAYNPCPTGWEHVEAIDEHTVVNSCTAGVWTVYLNSDGTFSHAWDEEGPFIETASEVPGWE